MNAYPKCTAILGVLLPFVLSFSAFQATAQQKPATALNRSATATQSYGKLPLGFVANQGEADAQARYFAHGNGYSLFLTDSAAVLRLTSGATDPGAESKDAAHLPMDSRRDSPKSDIVQLRLAGSFQRPTVEGTDRLPGTANFFIGNDPKKWHTGVPTYAKVKYTGVYPGIDLVYYGNQDRLEYDFAVAPGADPKTIKLQFGGARKLRLSRDGNLTVAVASSSIVFRRPEIYQLVDGKRDEVDGQFAFDANNSVGFKVGAYDHSKPLVIDPVLSYSTYLGGSNGDLPGDYITSMAVDENGNTYLAGVVYSSDFPATSGSYQTVNNGGDHITFITKLNAIGSALVYSTYIGNYGTKGAAIAVDGSANAYITGSTTDPNYPITDGAFQTTNAGGAAGTAFATKLNGSGTALSYSTFLGGSGGASNGTAIAVDASGDAYVAGVTSGYQFPVTAGAFQSINKGNQNEREIKMTVAMTPDS